MAILILSTQPPFHVSLSIEIGVDHLLTTMLPLDAKGCLQVRPSILLANPIPAEHSIDRHRMETIVAEAVSDAEQNGITGHANTPFILRQIRELTGGDSISANKALIEANVARGTRLAVEYQRLGRRYAANQGRDTKDNS